MLSGRVCFRSKHVLVNPEAGGLAGAEGGEPEGEAEAVDARPWADLRRYQLHLIRPT